MDPQIDSQRAYRYLRRAAHSCFLLVLTANLVSCYCLSTTNCKFCAMENSFWTLMELVACGALVYLSLHFYVLHTKTKDEEFISNARYLKNIAIGLFLTAVYTGFIDVPMYIKRYFEDTAANKEYIPAIEGWIKGFDCFSVTKDYKDWKEEIAWLTLYFTFALWVTNYLACNPVVITHKVKSS